MVSVQILWTSSFQLVCLKHFSGYNKTNKKRKKHSAPTCRQQEKPLKPNRCDCNNISDNNSMLCHHQSNDMGSNGLHDIQGVDFGMSENNSIATSSSALHYAGLRNMTSTCYINVLLQWLFHLVPFRHSLLESHVDVDTEALLKNINSSDLMFPTGIGHAQVTLFNLAQDFLVLQSICREMLSSRSPVVDPQSFIDAIGFPHKQSDCCHNARITLFQFYFDFLELSSHYR